MSRSKIPILLVVVGFLSIVTALGIFLSSRESSAHQKMLLPARLSGYALNQAVYGEEAIEGVIQLHGVDFPLQDAAIGTYGPQAEVTLWVSVGSDISAATELTNLMTDKINLGRSPFTSPFIKEMSGTPIYVLEGLDQQHFYWQKDEFIIWVAVDFGISHEILSETLAFYR